MSIGDSARFAVAVLALAAGSSAATPAPRSIEVEAERQFGLCLRPGNAPFDGPAAAALPPGLTRNAGIVAAHIPTATGVLYAFRDEGGGELVCGIAVYGVGAAKIERRLRARIAADRDFAPMPSNDSRSSHWRLAKAEGMGGIDLVRRAPSRSMPALEAERHQILVH